MKLCSLIFEYYCFGETHGHLLSPFCLYTMLTARNRSCLAIPSYGLSLPTTDVTYCRCLLLNLTQKVGHHTKLKKVILSQSAS